MAQYRHRFVRGERRPVEVLVFQMDPSHVEEFIAVDHEVWTLGEAGLDGFDHLPFVSKEVWVNDHQPGQVIITFVWDDAETWQRVGSADVQARLLEEFKRRFDHPAQMRSVHQEQEFGLHRVSRFERAD